MNRVSIIIYTIIMKNLLNFILLSSLILLSSCSDDDMSTKSENVSFDNYEVYDLENANAKIVEGDLVIEKLNENTSEFSFKLRPLTEQYWFNVYYRNLLISANRKITTKVNTLDKTTGEKFTGHGASFTSNQLQFYNGNDTVYSQKLFGISDDGEWNEPDIDTLVGPQPIWPIIWGAVAVGTYVLDKYDYKRITDYDANGNVTGSHSEHSWNGAAPPTDDGNGSVGIEMGEVNNYQFELYNNLLNEEPINAPDPNEPQQVVPVVIDGVEYTCTDINQIRIRDIINGRNPN